MTDYVVFDLETTGFSPVSNEIIQIGAFKVIGGVVTEKFVCFVKPVGYIPMQVQTLTGISMDDVSDANPIEMILPEFVKFCGDLPLLGHNIQFDYSFIIAKARGIGIDFTLSGTRQGIDTCELAKKYMRCADNKLGTVAKSIGVEIDSEKTYHNAGYDAYTTKLIYDWMLDSFPNILAVTTPSLLEKTKTVYGKVEIDDALSFE